MFSAFRISEIRRRKYGTLMCFMLGVALISSVLVYSDTYSYGKWLEETNVGPAAFVIRGANISEYYQVIASIDYVTKAAAYTKSWAWVFGFQNLSDSSLILSQGDDPYGPGETPPVDVNAVSFHDDFPEIFENIFNLTEGRFPTNSTEIALAEWVASTYSVSVGDRIVYGLDLSEPGIDLVLVGIYSYGELENTNSYLYSSGGAIVLTDLLGSRNREDAIFVDIDRSHLTPTNSMGGYDYLSRIQDEIHGYLDSIDTGTSAKPRIIYPLKIGITIYSDWLASFRLRNLSRSATGFLLTILVAGVSVRYSFLSRKPEDDYYEMRGSEQRFISRMIYSELLTSAIVSIGLGVLLGIVLSRIGLSSQDHLYFIFEISAAYPLLFTAESLFLVMCYGLGVPLLLTFSYRRFISIQKFVRSSPSRFSKLRRGAALVRWEAVIILFYILLIASLSQMGGIIGSIPFLNLILLFAPLLFFIASSSITIKLLRRLSNAFSQFVRRIANRPSIVLGARGVGRSSAMAGPIIIAVVLSLSLVFSNSILSQSLPASEVKHSQFAISGDILFELDKSYSSSWTEFKTNVSSNEMVAASTIVSTKTMFLSTGLEGAVKFVSINPEEYAFVGYNHEGLYLNESSLSEPLSELAQTPSGAILSRDVSERFSLSVGDSVRSFLGSENQIDVYIFNVIDIVDYIPDTLPGDFGYSLSNTAHIVGHNQILVNSEYFSEVLNSTATNYDYLCVRLNPSFDSSTAVQSIMSNISEGIIHNNVIAEASNARFYLTRTDTYQPDRAIDSLLSLIAIISIFPVFILYILAGMSDAEKNYTSLKVLGWSRIQISKVRVSEILTLGFFSIFFVIIISPIFIHNMLLQASSEYGNLIYAFPIPLIVTIPWLLLLIYILVFSLALLLISSLQFIFTRKEPDLLISRESLGGGER